MTLNKRLTRNLQENFSAASNGSLLVEAPTRPPLTPAEKPRLDLISVVEPLRDRFTEGLDLFPSD